MTAMTSSPRGERFPWAGVILVWLGLCAVLFAVAAHMGFSGKFLDPDDTMRLVQVRDLLAGQAWLDLHQYRIDPPHAPLMHWSRIVDAPLAGSILLLRPLLGQANAELVTALAVPLLTLAAIVFTISGTAFRLFGARTAMIAAAVCVLIPMVLTQAHPMRIDHHGWQIVAVVVAVSALLSRTRARGGWLAGLALAAGMSISLEVLPFAAAFAAVLALRWLVDRNERWWLVHFLAALATGLVVLTAATRGTGDRMIYCDVVGVPHLALFVWVALAAAAIARFRALPPFTALGLLGLAGAAGLGLFASIAPQCVGSPFGTLNTVVHDFWYVRVLEGQPIWKQDMPDSLAPLLQALVALGALVALWRRAPASERLWWLSYTLLFSASLVTGLLVWRSMAFTGALSAVPLAWLVTRLIAKAKGLRDKPHAALMQTLWGVGGLALLMPIAPINLVKRVVPAQAPAALEAPDCNLAASARSLGGFQPTIVFAPLDMGPDILANTRHSVVATAHHRAQEAMRDVILTFTASPDGAHAIVTAHHAGLLAICTDLAETGQYEAAAPHGLMARLVHGETPDWLQRVSVAGPASFRVWRVVK